MYLLALRAANSIVTILVFGSVLLFLVGVARAQTGAATPPRADARLVACEKSPACKSHLDIAIQLYEQGRYSPALEEFQAAYVLQPYPPILYNIARLHHKQKHLNEAVAYYQRYLDTGHKEQVERARQFIAAAQDELDILTEPPPAPLLPVPPEAVGAVPAAPTLAKAPSLSVRPAPREPSKPVYKRWWLWTVVGVAVIGAATGIGIGVSARGPEVSGVQRQTPSFSD